MGLHFKNVSHAYGQDQILNDVTLTAAAGEITCLLGPSGCGKTTLLRLAAGLLSLQEGHILLDETELSSGTVSVPPEKRPIGLVFQEGALFPHMSVEENIAFGIAKSPDKSDRVKNLLKTIGLTGFEKRHPHSLSGGQQQRVALARALAPNPKVLLLDEPFAAIDSQLRQDLRAETRQTLKESGTAAILVTHDPAEALDMADKIAILDRGQIAQFGSPQELLNNPATVEIASLFSRGTVLPAKKANDTLETAFGTWPWECVKNKVTDDSVRHIVVRSNSLTIAAAGDETTKIRHVRPSSDGYIITLEADDGQELVALSKDAEDLTEGMTVSVVPNPLSVFAFADVD